MKQFSKEFFDSARRIPFTDAMIRSIDAGDKTETRRPVKYGADGRPAKCLYGDPGDLLLATGSHIFLGPDGQVCGSKDRGARALYRVDWNGEPEAKEWRPPMFFPKWAPTRFLKSISVDMVNLCDITEEQALAEGIIASRIGVGDSTPGKVNIPEAIKTVYHWEPWPTENVFGTAFAAFRALWDSIHEDRGLLFDTNPTVWRIQFRRITSGE